MSKGLIWGKGGPNNPNAPVYRTLCTQVFCSIILCNLTFSGDHFCLDGDIKSVQRRMCLSSMKEWSKCEQRSIFGATHFARVDSLPCFKQPPNAVFPREHTWRSASRSHLWPTSRKTMLCGWTWLRASSNHSWTFWKERRLVMSNSRRPPTELR